MSKYKHRQIVAHNRMVKRLNKVLDPIARFLNVAVPMFLLWVVITYGRWPS